MPFDAATYQPPQPARRDTPASLLIGRAAHLLRRPRRWAKGTDTGSIFGWRRYCMVEAFYRAETRDDDGATERAALHALRDACALRLGSPDIPGFNDHPSTTHADVLACMHEAMISAMEDAPAFEIAAAG